MRKLVFMLALPLAAQNSSVRGPMSGYVLEANSVRPIVGVPGAAYLGDALISNARAAAVSPDGRNLVVNVEGKTLMLTSTAEGSWQSSVITEEFPNASLFAWDERSAAVAIYETGHMAIAGTAGLQAVDAPQGKVLAMVLADDGSIAAAVEGVGVMLLKSGTAPRLVSRNDGVVSLSRAGSDLFFADAVRGEVLKIANFANGGEATIFASGLDGAAGVAAWRGRLIVSSRAGRSVTAFSLSSGERMATVDVGFEPSSLARLNDGLWQLNAGASPAQLIDENLQTWFVPAGTDR